MTSRPPGLISIKSIPSLSRLVCRPEARKYTIPPQLVLSFLFRIGAHFSDGVTLPLMSDARHVLAPPQGMIYGLRGHLSVRSAKIAAAFCILFIPEFLALLYLAHSNYLPEADGSGYLISGYRVYTHFRDGGLYEGFHELYTVRGWRPIIF